MPLMLVVGLIVDFFTFKNIQVSTALSLLGLYFLAAGFAIAFIHFYDAPGITERHAVSRFARLLAQLAVQFAFGALLSASFIFYWFSGTISVSWPFILLIAFLMVSNDVFRHYYTEPVVQISVYFFVAFSLSTLALPLIFNSISVWLFVYAGILSLVFICFYVAMIARFVEHVKAQRRPILFSIFTIFAFMNGLYFFNLIPPIPLSLREAGVYHNVQRSGAEYVLRAEEESWFSRLLPGQTIHIGPGERVYAYASIFAPADLNTRVYHEWQHYDEQQKAWISRDRFSYNISGGRKDGYRGYSYKASVVPGKWRVDVETERGQVIGRIRFEIEQVQVTPPLQEIRR